MKIQELEKKLSQLEENAKPKKSKGKYIAGAVTAGAIGGVAHAVSKEEKRHKQELVNRLQKKYGVNFSSVLK